MAAKEGRRDHPADDCSFVISLPARAIQAAVPCASTTAENGKKPQKCREDCEGTALTAIGM